MTKARKRQRTSDDSDAGGPVTPPSIAPRAVFSYLKDTRGVLTWTRRDLEDCLRVKVREADAILALLHAQGYVQPSSGRGEWITTAAGETVSGSKAARLKRESVDRALGELSQRLSELNKRGGGDLRIEQAVAFGDFLSARSLVQTADVGIALTWKDGKPDRAQATRQSEVLKEMQGGSRFFHLQKYEHWMGERCHRDLLAQR